MKFSIDINSVFRELNKCRVTLECEGLDDDGRRCFFLGREWSPEGEAVSLPIAFQTEECRSLRLFLFAVPVSLPGSRSVKGKMTFPLSVTVSDGKTEVFKREIEINRWSGTNLAIEIP